MYIIYDGLINVIELKIANWLITQSTSPYGVYYFINPISRGDTELILSLVPR